MTDVEIVEQVLCRPEGIRREEGFLEDSRLRDLLPELYRLEGVPQDPRYHPEGDVLVHTLRAVQLLPPDPDRRLAWAALLHDLGKAETTREIDGRLRALGHDRRGAELAEMVLRRLGMPPEPRADIVWLIRHHMFPLTWQPNRHGRPGRRQLAVIADPRFPLLLDLAEIDALAGGRSPRRLERVAHYRRLRTQRAGSDVDLPRGDGR